ncbi:lipid IV(A) 3-deoxy-D-manno-octulosonic acid transferase [Psychromonas sp. 14N.309.X.WAT.B.A12]|uniref:lipid IV(A) 3-deoxy-D-manno-octulosonic acid transferase n=1 Tax=Psychromonas sp. 14N.309.X.WAT.B.A12 TaxID=2998322 RepID=UPI0025AF1491|nr:lipid IV(A) 3-deoxy-D-manno-octulosonic acid transferase [Psychromonas sp. 14N.309.X.WAT.B.A12]MDN2664642.1 lipid IV(A) 3-deoxy-D-manno-octulosonic acid transferase [Psychromonas sp. 14N.309.X.WAT.B.A12]
MLLRLIYRLLLILVAPIFLIGLYKSKPNKPKFGKRWKEHFGITPPINKTFNNPIWVHAVSVGEVVAITPLIKELKKQTPSLNILLTTTTSTGANEVKKLGDLVEHRYMPLDFPFAIKSFINRMQPKALFIMETELWPNTLHYCQKMNIAVTIINARLSERSATRYKKFPFIFNLLLRNIDFVLAQTQHDAQRFINLGLSPHQTQVTGSIKFDIKVTPTQLDEAKKLRAALGNARPVWIAASTHKGEDEQVIAAHQQVLTSIPEALLIIVPRHPERFSSVQELVTKNKLSVISRSSQHNITEQTQVYLGDTMGEMMVLLGASDVCFIAGSLIGDKVGGHNLLEAAALKKPILNGPSYFNFKEITEQLTILGACTICQDAKEIANAIKHLFANEQIQNEQGKQALAFVERNQGALLKTSKAILSIIDDKP